MKMVRAQPSGGANIIFKDDPARAKLVKFASPTLIWSTKSGSSAAQMASAKGATASVVLDLVRATRFERGFDFELGVKQGDGTVRRYTLTIFPMQVRALQGNEVRMLGTNLDNTGYHEYRIAVRPDGIAQVYLDNTPLGLLAGEIVPDEEGIKESYMRIGKTVSRGDFIAHLAAAGFDTDGAFAPSAEGPSVKMQAGEEDREEL